MPTATSVRTVPAKLLEVNRQILNNQLARTTGAKVSFTHLIGYAVVRALGVVPALNASLRADRSTAGRGPGVVRHRHVGLGLAVDLEKSDGSRTLLVPCIKGRRHPRLPLLRPGLRGPRAQGALRPAPPRRLRRHHGHADQPRDPRHGPVRAPADARPGRHRRRGGPGLPGGLRGHRPPGPGRAGDRQGRHPHLHLRPPRHPGRGVRALPGPRGRVPDGRAPLLRRRLRVDGRPLRAGALAGGHQRRPTTRPGTEHGRLVKQVHVQTLINMYRVRGHLIAHLDPLDAEPPRIHPELDPLTYGLTIWDLPRRFVADGLAGRDVATLDEILHLLRDAYCRTLGVEYMHIQDPEQKRWIQQHVEGVPDRGDARGAAPRPRAAERRRGLRAVPPHPLRRPEALRAGGRRVDHRAPRHRPRRGGHGGHRARW